MHSTKILLYFLKLIESVNKFNLLNPNISDSNTTKLFTGSSKIKEVD